MFFVIEAWCDQWNIFQLGKILSAVSYSSQTTITILNYTVKLPGTNKLSNSFAKCFLPYGNIKNQLAFCCCFSLPFTPVLFENLWSYPPMYHSKVMISEKMILLLRNSLLWSKSIYQYRTLCKGLFTWPKLAILILLSSRRCFQTPQVLLGHPLSLNHAHTFMKHDTCHWTEIRLLHLL